MKKFDENKYKSEFDKKNYKFYGFRLKHYEAKMFDDFISNDCKISKNEFIRQALFEKIERYKLNKS